MELEPISVVQTASWADLLTVLVVGLSTAFALQVFLFCLGTAIALSTVKLPSLRPSHKQESDSSATDSKMGMLAGFGILGTINFVVFIASFFATAFIHFQSPVTGAIAGIVLWAFYLGFMLWLSFITVNSLAEGLLNFVTLGVRRIVLTGWNLFRGKKDEQQHIHEQIEIAIREEVQTAFESLEQALVTQQLHPTLSTGSALAEPLEVTAETQLQSDQGNSVVQAVWQKIGNYIHKADKKKLSSKELDRKLQKILKSLPNGSVIDASTLKIQIEELTEILAQRQDLSKKTKTRIIEQIQTSWEIFYTNSNKSKRHAEAIKFHPSESMDAASNVETITDNEATPFSLPDVTQLQAFVGEAITPIVAKLSTEEIKQPLERLAQSQIDLADLNHTLKEQALQIRDRTTDQMMSIQQTLQEGTQSRLEAIQQDLQNRLEITRKTAATTAWWLLATILTSGISAALAGALSTRL